MSIQNYNCSKILNIVKKQIIFNSYHSLLSDLKNIKLCSNCTKHFLTSKRYISSSKNNIIPNENKPFIFEAGKFIMTWLISLYVYKFFY